MKTWHDGGLGLVFGTYEHALAMVGEQGPTRSGEVEVNWPMIKYFCSAIEDPNPVYWDLEFATRVLGAVPSPPSMMPVWVVPIQWRPGGPPAIRPLARSVPLPGPKVVNVSTESEYLAAVVVGDRISVIEQVIDVSQEKSTHLGSGHFVTTTATYSKLNGDSVARTRSTQFRYEPAAVRPPADSTPERASRTSGDVAYPHEIEFDLTYRRVILDAAATWDFNPAHHDLDFARAQGLRSIFVNTYFLEGLIDRLAGEWSGCPGRVVRRTLSMRTPIFAGDHVKAIGRVADSDQHGLVTVEVKVATESSHVNDAARATVTLASSGHPPHE